MSIVPAERRTRGNGYPTTDGKPMAETDVHRDLMMDLIRTLQAFYAEQDRVYVSGNLLVFYERGNKRKHLSPDVFVVRGVEKRQRENYLIWEEGKAPECVIELTSSSTRSEDTRKKFELYRDTLEVREYFLFDPKGDYLDPRLRAYRLRKGEYRSIRAVEGRFPSQVLGLHLEQDGDALRLWSPGAGGRLATPTEAREHLAARLHQEQAVRQALEQHVQQEQAARQALEQRVAQLEAMIKKLPSAPANGR